MPFKVSTLYETARPVVVSSGWKVAVYAISFEYSNELRHGVDVDRRAPRTGR